MHIPKHFRFLAVGLALSVVFAGCELFDDLFGDLIDLSMFVDELDDGELEVTVTGLDVSFDRVDVWVEEADLDAIDAYLDLEDIDDEEAVESAVNDWMEEEHDMPSSLPSESGDIYAGYGAEIGGDDVSKMVDRDAEIVGGEIEISEDPSNTLEGGIYIVYAIVRENATEARIGVTFAIVDGDEEVTLDYDDDFEDFGDD